MNVNEKALLKDKVREILWEHKGLRVDKVRANDYIDLYDTSFSPILDILVEGLDEIFEIKLKDKSLVRWKD